MTMILVLCRLGDAALWEDEGITGLLGAHIIKFGLPHVQDGDLKIFLLPGETRHGIWIWDGWLQAYLSAAGGLFGRTVRCALFRDRRGADPWASYSLFRSMTRRRTWPRRRH
jgi:hypothetical protein